MTIEDLITRITFLEDRAAIESLCVRYGNLCDEGFSPVEISEMFTPNGVWDGGEMAGTHSGRAEIRQFLERLQSAVTWSGHYVLNELFEIDGNHASGLWRCVAPVNNRGEEGTVDRWFFQDYYFDLLKVDGRWFLIGSESSSTNQQHMRRYFPGSLRFWTTPNLQNRPDMKRVQ